MGDGSLKSLQLKIFERLKSSLDERQSKDTAYVQIEATFSGIKSQLTKSPTLANFHFLSNG